MAHFFHARSLLFELVQTNVLRTMVLYRVRIPDVRYMEKKTIKSIYENDPIRRTSTDEM